MFAIGGTPEDTGGPTGDRLGKPLDTVPTTAPVSTPGRSCATEHTSSTDARNKWTPRIWRDTYFRWYLGISRHAGDHGAATELRSKRAPTRSNSATRDNPSLGVLLLRPWCGPSSYDVKVR